MENILDTINIKLRVPQVGTSVYEFKFDDDRVILYDTSLYDNYMDFIVTDEGVVKLGKGHFKLNSKKNTLSMAGEILISNNGKIKYLNNNSGHYSPNKYQFLKFIVFFRKKYLYLLDNGFTFEIIDWRCK